MRADLTPIHPELRSVWRRFPRLTFNRRTAPIFHWLTRLRPKPLPPDNVLVDRVTIQSQDGTHPLRLRVYKPELTTTPAPGLVWIHGGGRECGVACESLIVTGAFHGFDVLGDDLPVIRDFRASQRMAMRRYLFP